MKTIVLDAPRAPLAAPWHEATAPGALLRRGVQRLATWWQAQRAQRAARRAHLALIRLGAPTLRDIGAGPELLAAAHAHDQAAQWRRLELHLTRDEARDPRTW